MRSQVILKTEVCGNLTCSRSIMHTERLILVPCLKIKLCSLLTACELHFDNTPIPVDNVLGDVGGGFKVCS